VEPFVDVLWSCIVALKDVQNSPRYEGYTDALDALGEVVDEIRVGTPTQHQIGVSDGLQAVEDAILLLSVTGFGVSKHPTLDGLNETQTAVDDQQLPT